MGNFITAISTDYADLSTVTATTANASFPATNTGTTLQPYALYKGTAAVSTAEALVFDMATATSLDAVVLDNVNMGTVVIQGHATDSWGAPSYDSGNVLVSQDARDGRYKLYHTLVGTGFDSTGYRFLRVQAGASATVDDETTFNVGSVAAVKTITTWTYNPNNPFEYTFQQAVDPGEKASGGVEPSSLGNPYVTLSLTGSPFPTSMEDTPINALMRHGQHRAVMFFYNQSDTSEVYQCVRSATVRVRKAGPNHIEVTGIVLREAA